MTTNCIKATQYFHCAELRVFTTEKSAALWSANIRKLAKNHKGYGSTATQQYDLKKDISRLWCQNGDILLLPF